jgi:hypothetical protein
MKRRRKREKERLLKKQSEETEAEVTVPEAVFKQMASDEFSSKQIIRTDSKILNFDFEPTLGRGKDILISFSNNSIELYHRKKQTGTHLYSQLCFLYLNPTKPNRHLGPYI